MMTFQRTWLVFSFLVLESTRLWSWNGRRKLPVFWGQDWFFGLQVRPGFYDGPGKEILSRYKKQITFPFLVEFLCLTPVFLFAHSLYLLPATVATSIMLVIWHQRTTKAAVKAAQPHALPQPETTSPVTLSLKRRGLWQYTSPAIEAAISIFTIAGLAIFSHYYWYFNWEGEHTLSAVLPLVLYFYVQLGGLLVKQSIVRFRVAAPAEEADRYFTILEERRLVFLRLCDNFRIILAAVLPYYLFRQVARDVLKWTYARLVHVAVGLSVMAAMLIVLSWYVRRMRAILSQVDPYELLKIRRRVSQTRPLLGGLARAEADNPGAVVRTTSGLALNLANKRYLYSIYILGFIALVVVFQLY
jgi:hypothetical protein